MYLNVQWLAEFTGSFEQLMEGEDGDIVGRQIWRGYSEAECAARIVDPTMGYDDALAEADAWNATIDDQP